MTHCDVIVLVPVTVPTISGHRKYVWHSESRWQVRLRHINGCLLAVDELTHYTQTFFDC
jgi:hypothetical protein